MKIYHTETQADYDALMIELGKQGYLWVDGERLNLKNYFKVYKSETTITKNSHLKYIRYADVNYDKIHNPNVEIIKYKAKAENKVEKKCEKCDVEYHDNAKYCSMCGNKLVEEPEFKVGDYVIEQNGNIISKIGEVLNGDFWGSYYKKINNYFSNLGGNILIKDIERLATPEEILEYESALNFNKRGREPFEVKKGDLIRTPSEKITLIWNPENYTKEEFLDYGWKLLKTAEEIDEWLGVSDE